MWSKEVEAMRVDDLINMLGWVEVVFMALDILEFEPEEINRPPFILKVPLKSMPSSTPLDGPFTMGFRR